MAQQRGRQIHEKFAALGHNKDRAENDKADHELGHNLHRNSDDALDPKNMGPYGLQG